VISLWHHIEPYLGVKKALAVNAKPEIRHFDATEALSRAHLMHAPVVLLTGQPVIVAPALGVTAETINLMAREGRGLICHAMTAAQMLELGLSLLPSTGAGNGMWRFAVSYEAGSGCSTGISATDRARTLNAGAADRPGQGTILTPGHVIPVLGDASGPGDHPPSAALRLMALAGIAGGAAICTILDTDGAVASPETAGHLAARLGLWAVQPGAMLHAAGIVPFGGR